MIGNWLLAGELALIVMPVTGAEPTPTPVDSNGPYLITIILALVTSGGFWGVVTWLLGIRERRRKEKADQEAEEKEEEDRKQQQREKDVEYDKLLSAAQAEAQRTALMSADQRYSALHEDYTKCLDGLRENRRVSFHILDVLETLTNKFTIQEDGVTFHTTMTAEEMTTTKTSIKEARTALYQL